MSAPDSSLPLAGVRVVELAGVLAGPTVGQFLAELGAEVVKVEPPAGDVTRTWHLAAEDPADDRPAYVCAANWGKTSVAIDLRNAADRARLAGLLDAADVVLTAYKPGDAARWGLDADTLRATRPRLIVADLTGYGANDPRAGYDAVVQAEAGWMHLCGAAGGPPTKLPIAFVDLMAAHQMKEAVLVALFRRERTGQGATIRLSLVAAAVSALANQGTAWLVAGVSPRRSGSAHPSIAPYGTPYATATGDVVLAVGTDAQFASLCRILGLDLHTDARFATNAARVRHREALDAALVPALAAADRDALLTALAVAHVPAGAVRTVPEAFDHPEAARLVVRDGSLAGIRQVAFTLDGAPPTRLAPPPHRPA